MAVHNLYALLNLLFVASPTLISKAAAACGQGYSYNASGSVDIPFPQPPSSSPSGPSGNYTLFTRLSLPDGATGLNQSFGAVNASGFPVSYLPLGYEGCLFAFSGSPLPATQDHINVPNKTSCQAALSADCMDNIIESASERANQLSRQNQATSGSWNCQFSIPSKCDKFSTMFSGGFYSASGDAPPDYYSSNTSSTNCRPGAQMSISGVKDGTDLSTYLEKLDEVTPILLMAWNNASSNPDGKPWSDTRFLCMSTDEIMPGSKSSASSSLRPSWAGCYWGLVGVVGLSVFIL